MQIKNYQCAIEVALDVIGGKWKCIILYHLNKHETLRFGELLRIAKGASTKMIAQQLGQLEAHGLITKTIYPVVPPHVEYTITEYGKTLAPILQQMSEWGSYHWYLIDP